MLTKNQITECTERILRCCIPDLTTNSCDIQRTVVSKILKEIIDVETISDKFECAQHKSGIECWINGGQHRCGVTPCLLSSKQLN